MSKEDGLKRTIDRMVEASIRKILPEVLNEVLLRTLAGSGVMAERAARPQEEPERATAPARRPPPRPGSLAEMLDPAAGSEFYERDAPRPVQQQPPKLAQRIASLPPEMQELAEDTADGEMWGDDEWSSPAHDQMSPQAPSLNIDNAARIAQVDFSRAKMLLERTGPKNIVTTKDRAAEAQFEERRLAMARQKLEYKPEQ